MSEEEGGWDLKWELLVADTWDDAELKQRLLSDPAAVLTERGIAVPEGTSVNVVEEAADSVTLVLPAAPGEDELSEEELESVAGGGHLALCFSLSGGRCGGGGRCFGGGGGCFRCSGCGGRCSGGGGCGGRCGGGGCGGRCGGGGGCGGRCRP